MADKILAGIEEISGRLTLIEQHYKTYPQGPGEGRPQGRNPRSGATGSRPGPVRAKSGRPSGETDIRVHAGTGQAPDSHQPGFRITDATSQYGTPSSRCTEFPVPLG
jgi:hypothetical protein